MSVVRVLRGLSGAVAAGVVVLTAVVIVAAVLGRDRGFPGPGPTSITAHVVASVVVLVAQLAADRRGGLVAFVGALVVFGVTGLLLWTQWWG